MEKYAIIVAGGKGLRMGQDLPKQFISVGERPILMHTIQAFVKTDKHIKIILVLPKEQFDYWNALCELHNFKIPLLIVEGGSTRFHSVKNGLKQVSDGALVAIHDGVRPFVSTSLIQNGYEQAAISGGAIPVIPVVDSIRQVQEDGSSVAIDREKLRFVQTPQVFRSGLILKAYQQPYNKLFTDDASVFEAAGFKTVCIPGERENIKITTPFDLLIAEALCQE